MHRDHVEMAALRTTIKEIRPDCDARDINLAAEIIYDFQHHWRDRSQQLSGSSVSSPVKPIFLLQ